MVFPALNKPPDFHKYMLYTKERSSICGVCKLTRRKLVVYVHPCKCVYIQLQSNLLIEDPGCISLTIGPIPNQNVIFTELSEEPFPI